MTATKYRVILYHDEPEEASTDTRGAGLFDSAELAIAGARAELGEYWHTATVDRGTWHEGQLGIEPDWFEEDDVAPLAYVGPTWIDRYDGPSDPGTPA